MDSTISLNLQRKAMIAISQYFWQQAKIQDDIHKMMCNIECEIDDLDWKDFTRDKILSKLSEFKFPDSIKSELFYVVRQMGKEIYFWHEFISISNVLRGNDLAYTKKLYWTPLGKIDVQRVIEENWLNQLNPNVMQRVFDMCLDHGLDKARVARISHDMASLYGICRSVETKRQAAFYYVNRDDPVNERRIALEFGFSLDGQLLKLLVNSGNCQSVKSLWTRLDQATRDSIIMEAFGVAYDKSHSDYGYNFMPRRFEEIFMFLFDNMTNEQKLQVLRSPKWHMLQRLTSWPWLTLLMPNLHLFWTNIQNEHDIEKSIGFVDGLIDQMIIEADFGHSRVMFNVLREVLHEMPDRIGFDVTKTVRSYMECWILDYLKYLVNCSLFEDKKDLMVETMQGEYVKIRSEKTADKIADLDEFVGEVFLTVEEKDAFRQKMRARSDFVNMKEKEPDL